MTTCKTSVPQFLSKNETGLIRATPPTAPQGLIQYDLTLTCKFTVSADKKALFSINFEGCVLQLVINPGKNFPNEGCLQASQGRGNGVSVRIGVVRWL